MERHFQKELEGLKTSLVKMGSVVEENFAKAIQAITKRDMNLTESVLEMDERINALEIEIDNTIIDLLALQQPVASDLRFILAALKINNDLERIGDHCVNIAEANKYLAKNAKIKIIEEIPQMATITQSMLKDSLDSFILQNPTLAQKVLNTDDQIDDLNKTVTKKVIDIIKQNTESVECDLELVRISRNLERIADLTTNIAEEVIFHAQARIVKHHAEEKNIK